MTLAASQTDVRFDFGGALDLARQLWALAEVTEATLKSRSSLAAAAQTSFAGEFAGKFAQRISVERAQGSAIAQDLREAATECAIAWKKATDEENRRRYARKVERIKAKENVLEQALYHFIGSPFPPEPSPVRLPQPPAFAPTDTPVCVG